MFIMLLFSAFSVFLVLVHTTGFSLFALKTLVSVTVSTLLSENIKRQSAKFPSPSNLICERAFPISDNCVFTVQLYSDNRIIASVEYA